MIGTKKSSKDVNTVLRRNHFFQNGAGRPAYGLTISVTLFFIDHADRKIRSETYTVLIVDGATTFVTAVLQEQKTVMKLRSA